MSRPVQHHRTLFLSDLHLGALGSRSDLILAFLRENRADTYVLVGDILDLWHPLLPHWSAGDGAVLDHLRQRIGEGAMIHYLRGNHDPDPSCAPGARRLDVPVQDSMVHLAADGRRFLVLHGDIADARSMRSHAMTRLGSRIDHLLRLLDRGLSRMRRGSPAPTRSTIEALLSGINTLLYRGNRHEARLIAMARVAGLDGVICGHFHIARLKDREGLIYANCGDWVDSMTALAEGPDGALRLMVREAGVARPAGDFVFQEDAG